MKVVLVYQLFIRRVSHYTIRRHKNCPSKQLKRGDGVGSKGRIGERGTGNGERGTGNH